MIKRTCHTSHWHSAKGQVILKTNNMERTAVAWLFTTLDNMLELYPSEWEKVSKAVEQAKSMEKEQITDADLNATIRTAKGANSDVSVRRVKELAEEYYNEKYNK